MARALCVARDDFTLRVSRRNIFTRIAELFGFYGLLIGDPELERKYTIKSSNDPQARSLMGDRRLRGVWPLAAAATVAAVSLGVWIGRAEPPRSELAGAEFVAGGMEAATVALSDGSFVHLDPGSTVGDDSLDEVVESICLLVESECEIDEDGVRIGL